MNFKSKIVSSIGEVNYVSLSTINGYRKHVVTFLDSSLFFLVTIK